MLQRLVLNRHSHRWSIVEQRLRSAYQKLHIVDRSLWQAMATLVAKRFSIYFGCWQQHITQPLLHPTKFLLPMTSYRCRRQESISVAINHRTLFNPVVVVVVVGARDFQPAATDITLEFCQRRCHFAAITFLVSKFANCIQRWFVRISIYFIRKFYFVSTCRCEKF